MPTSHKAAARSWPARCSLSMRNQRALALTITMRPTSPRALRYASSLPFRQVVGRRNSLCFKLALLASSPVGHHALPDVPLMEPRVPVRVRRHRMKPNPWRTALLGGTTLACRRHTPSCGEADSINGNSASFTADRAGMTLTCCTTDHWRDDPSCNPGIETNRVAIAHGTIRRCDSIYYVINRVEPPTPFGIVRAFHATRGNHLRCHRQNTTGIARKARPFHALTVVHKEVLRL